MIASARVLTLGLSMLFPVAVSATPLTWTFGSVLPVDPGGAASGSTRADVILVIDSLTPDLDPSSSFGKYAVQSTRVEWENGHVSTVSGASSLFVTVGSGIQWVQSSPSPPGSLGIQGTGGFPTTDALLTTSLGAVIPLTINFLTTDDLGVVIVIPETLTIVPEPALAGLLGLALLTARRRWRSRCSFALRSGEPDPSAASMGRSSRPLSISGASRHRPVPFQHMRNIEGAAPERLGVESIVA